VNEKFQWFEFLLGVMVGAILETLFSLLEKL
jgi:multisubunit Na+/H+ antiporter MnhE subunit